MGAMYGLKRNQPSKPRKSVVQESKAVMSKLSECKLINNILLNFQQVCCIFKFKNNQQTYNRSIKLQNELKRNVQ